MAIIEVATWLIGVSYVAAFLLLTAQASREAGRSVWLFKQGDSAQAIPAMLFRIAFVGAVIWPPVSHMAGFSGKWAFTGFGDALDVVGNVATSLGVSIAIASQVYMGKSWRIGAAQGELGNIVQSGPFALSRNPVFVGQLLLFLGLFAANPEPVQFALLMAMLIAVNQQVSIEEPALSASLGPEYDAYCGRVRRWI
jgi:protein-S-isoprenylcysteine O-methyltransferase Ste14